jgi:magnesium chelatase family protein
MLAARFPGICPPLSDDEALEVAALQASSQDRFSVDQWRRRPFRHPHHSVTAAAMTGGGPHARPGEVSLAHCGTLHLDEMAEFARSVLEMLREPMETGAITISRAARKLNYPARFQLVGAMNPCPCGYRGHPSGRCHCTPEQVARYARRISGPLLDRIDLQLEVPALAPGELQEGPAGESSSQIRARVMQAVDRQLRRQGRCNALLTGAELTRHVALDEAVQRFLLQAAQQFQLSARAMHRVLRVARTVADIEGRDLVDRTALGEAFCYRGSLYNPW